MSTKIILKNFYRILEKTKVQNRILLNYNIAELPHFEQQIFSLQW